MRKHWWEDYMNKKEEENNKRWVVNHYLDVLRFNTWNKELEEIIPDYREEIVVKTGGYYFKELEAIKVEIADKYGHDFFEKEVESRIDEAKELYQIRYYEFFFHQRLKEFCNKVFWDKNNGSEECRKASSDYKSHEYPNKLINKLTLEVSKLKRKLEYRETECKNNIDTTDGDEIDRGFCPAYDEALYRIFLILSELLNNSNINFERANQVIIDSDDRS